MEVAVIGGGLAGLAAAWRLYRRGVDVHLFEARDRVGGFVATLERDGFLVETGPASLRGDRGAIGYFIQALGLGDTIVPAAPAAKRRYIYAKGRLNALSAHPLSLLKSSLLSWPGKLRLLSEPLRKARPNADETLASLLRRRLGAEAVALLADPFVTGIYAGDVERLGVDAFPELAALEREHGSLFAGLKKGGAAGGIYTLRAGLGAIATRAAAVLGDRLHLGAAVTLADVRARKVIVATGAHEAAALVGAPALAAIEHAPIVRVEVGVRAEDVNPIDGFGVLVASSSPLPTAGRVMGVVFSSSVFEGRAPTGHRSFSVMLGGVRDPGVVDRSDEALVAQATAALNDLVGLRAAPVMTTVVRWPRAIPQYTPGHARRIEAVRAALPAHVLLAGNYLTGPSAEASVASGFAASDAALIGITG